MGEMCTARIRSILQVPTLRANANTEDFGDPSPGEMSLSLSAVKCRRASYTPGGRSGQAFSSLPTLLGSSSCDAQATDTMATSVTSPDNCPVMGSGPDPSNVVLALPYPWV